MGSLYLRRTTFVDTVVDNGGTNMETTIEVTHQQDRASTHHGRDEQKEQARAKEPLQVQCPTEACPNI